MTSKRVDGAGGETHTVSELSKAQPFMNHRELVAAITPLKDRGAIDAYSINRHPAAGYAAGIRIGDEWSYLGVGI